MKRLTIIVPLLLVLFANRASSQATCTLDCCNECFPYWFCTSDSTPQLLMCSNSPFEMGHPALSFIPSCVTVDAMPSQAIWQPNGPPPSEPYLLSNAALGNDSKNEEAGAATQRDTDLTLFITPPGQPPVPPVSPRDESAGKHLRGRSIPRRAFSSYSGVDIRTLC